MARRARGRASDECEQIDRAEAEQSDHGCAQVHEAEPSLHRHDAEDECDDT
jgi:hypothetical protein